MALGGCAERTDGTPTWPGERLANSLLVADELPDGVQYDRVIADPGPVAVNNQPIVGSMPSEPPGCADGMSAGLVNAGKPGPENTARYIARFNGANIIVSVLRDKIDLGAVKSVANRCAKYQVFFDQDSPGTQMTTEPVDTEVPDLLVYKQTMTLARGATTRYMAFGNINGMALISMSFDLRDPTITAVATMPQTFLDVVTAQAQKMRAN